MWLTYLLCFIFYYCTGFTGTAQETNKSETVENRQVLPLSAPSMKNIRVLPRPRFKVPRVREKLSNKVDSCWMTFNAEDHFNEMDALEKKHAKIRKQHDDQIATDTLDQLMLSRFIDNQGATDRETQKAGNMRNMIPSGINLGGYSMMRMPDSVLFFHRMKLRNNTQFRVGYLSSNLSTMTLVSRLLLNDLHLMGNYERAQTKEDPGLLQYTPTYGQIEILLRDVIYKMEGRYRLQKDRLYLEMIISQLFIPMNGIIMMYTNSTNNAEQQTLETKNIADFLDRLKSDLDLWIKDFFNEFLLNFPLNKIKVKKSLLQYDKERIMALNRFVDTSLDSMKNRLRSLNMDVVKLPSFIIYSFNGLLLHMKDGSLSGLDTMYRRSMGTNTVNKEIRKVDALIAFSSLKVRYSYEVKLTTGAPPLYGSLILTADELSAIMSLSMLKEPVFVDLKLDFSQQLKPESLTVEGSVGRMISSFKHFLELHIISIMRNTMIDQVHQLSSLAKCRPTLISYSPRTNNQKELLKRSRYSRQRFEERGPEDDEETSPNATTKMPTASSPMSTPETTARKG